MNQELLRTHLTLLLGWYEKNPYQLGKTMDGLQSQITNLNYKVDQLHEIVERLSQQIMILTAEKQQQQAVNKRESLMYPQPPIVSDMVDHSFYSSIMEHKDILLDNNDKKDQMTTHNETTISADIQIRRLTAQLTAAYNRIAALEEQLLTYRIHS